MNPRSLEDLLREAVRAHASAPPPVIVLPPPDRVAHYRIEARLGDGTSDVYLARDESLGRPVALRVLPPFLEGDEARRARLLAEVRAAEALTHPNLVSIYEVFEENRRACVAMELVSGCAMRALLDARPLTTRAALRLVHELARGLAPAHHAGLVHRALSPARVITTLGGRVKILGLGLALARGAVEPSAYDSPELVAGEEVRASTDVFSLGAMLREMTLASPPAPVRALVRRCVERDPRARIADAGVLADELALLVAR